MANIIRKYIEAAKKSFDDEMEVLDALNDKQRKELNRYMVVNNLY